MKITGILSVSNFVELGYPAIEVVNNLQGLCDEVIVGVDPSCAPDAQEIAKLKERAGSENIHVVDAVWNRDNISGGSEIALQMDHLVFTAATRAADWVVVLQADEFLHQKDFDQLRELMAQGNNVDGFCLERLYFWKDFATIREDWNAPMVRLFRPSTYSFVSQGSTGDGMTTGKLGWGMQVDVPHKIYHYSRVGEAREISRRIRNLDTLFHPEDTLVSKEDLEEYDFVPRKYDNYSKIESPEKTEGRFVTYTGTHPEQAERRYLRTINMHDVTIITSCESKSPGHKDYEELAIRLAYSIRKNAGALKDVPIVMWHGEDRPPSQATVSILNNFGCKLVSGPVKYEDKRLFNKITAMATPIATKYGLWVDSDIYVLGDFSDLLNGDPDIAASPTNYCFHRWADFSYRQSWDTFYSSVGIENPNKVMLTDMDQKEGIFYLCSGLVLFRSDIGFPKLYEECAEAILSTDVEERVANFSQTSLTLATVKGGFKFKQIPEKYQVCYSLRKCVPEGTVLVHYQDCIVHEVAEDDWYAGGLIARPDLPLSSV